jgi:hypothetical protein
MDFQAIKVISRVLWNVYLLVIDKCFTLMDIIYQNKFSRKGYPCLYRFIWNSFGIENHLTVWINFHCTQKSSWCDFFRDIKKKSHTNDYELLKKYWAQCWGCFWMVLFFSSLFHSYNIVSKDFTYVIECRRVARRVVGVVNNEGVRWSNCSVPFSCVLKNWKSLQLPVEVVVSLMINLHPMMMVCMSVSCCSSTRFNAMVSWFLIAV